MARSNGVRLIRCLARRSLATNFFHQSRAATVRALFLQSHFDFQINSLIFLISLWKKFEFLVGWFCGVWILQIYETVCKGAYRNFNSGVCNPSRILGNYTSKNGNFNFCLLGLWEFGNMKIKMKFFEVWMNNTQYPISTQDFICQVQFLFC